MSIASTLSAEEVACLIDAVWDHSLFGLALVAEDGKFIRVNKAFCDLCEYTEYELQQRTFMDITIPDDVRPDTEMAKRVAHGDVDSYDMVKHYLTKTKRIVRITLRVTAIRLSDGNFEYFLSQIAPAAMASPSATQLQVTSGVLAMNWWRSNWAMISGWAAAIGAGVAAFVAFLGGSAR